jgi:hypothetical protein
MAGVYLQELEACDRMDLLLVVHLGLVVHWLCKSCQLDYCITTFENLQSRIKVLQVHWMESEGRIVVEVGIFCNDTVCADYSVPFLQHPKHDTSAYAPVASGDSNLHCQCSQMEREGKVSPKCAHCYLAQGQEDRTPIPTTPPGRSLVLASEAKK